MTEFRKELEHLLNRHSIDSACNTQDFILAKMLCGFLKAIELSEKEKIRCSEYVKKYSEREKLTRIKEITKSESPAESKTALLEK